MKFWPYGTTVLLAVLLGLLGASWMVTFQNLPEIEALADFSPKGITVLRDQDGEKAYEYFQERRIPLPFEQIPEQTKQAFLVAEDWGFYDHFGIDIRGIIRAAITNVIQRRFSQGASTITQQLSRNLFLSHKKTLQRKLKEVILTLRIEQRFTKDEILTLYLNQIYLGEGTYGVEQAAQAYFGKSIQALTIEENALLASLPKNPNIFSPFRNPDLSLSRRNLILQWIHQRNVISKHDMLIAKETPLPTEKKAPRSKQNYFTYSVLEELQLNLEPQIIEKGQLEILSSYDPILQQASQHAIEQGLQAYQKRHPKKTDDLPQMASISMDVHTGAIKAIVGGVDFAQSNYNRALVAERQVGSAIKALLYALAFDKGFTQSTFVLDAPIRFQHPEFGIWEPENYDNQYDGFLPLRVALEKSKNTPAVRILQELHIGTFQRWLRRLGISTDIPPDLTIALGSNSIRLPELAKAYAHFANGGYGVTPHLFQKVMQKDHVLYEKNISTQKNIQDSIAFITTDALTGVIENGTGMFARDIGCEMAGKTGTTNRYIDSIFVGFSSEIVTVVWVGYDNNQSLGYGETGSRAAGRIWKEIMKVHCEKDQPGPFLAPQSIEWATVDHQTGLLPNKYSIALTQQAYEKGTAPQKDCCVPVMEESP